MTAPKGNSRRTFLGQSLAMGSAVSLPQIVPAPALGLGGQAPASEKIGVGLIGCGGMGRANLANCAKYPDVVVTAACDPIEERLTATVKAYPETCKPYKDYRQLLEAKDVDAVIIASVPHWHCLQAVEAAAAGKHLFIQKPMTLYLGESLAVLGAVKRHQVVSQVGTQIHASENYRRVVEYIRSGKLGPISVVRTFNVMNQGKEGVGRDPGTPVPAGVDWEMWIGPAPWRPYNRILAASSYHHCSWMDYSGGWLPGMAPHIIDLPIWALELGYPTHVSCLGGRFVIEDDGDAPDVQEVLWQYPSLTMTWMGVLVNSYGFDFHGEPVPRRRLGIYFHGLNGTLYADYGTYKVVPEGDRLPDPSPPERSIPPSPGHEREWLDGIKGGPAPLCRVEYHTFVDVPIVLGNLSLKLKRTIRFDPQTKQIVGDEEAARLAIPEYRKPWKFPEEYLRYA
jgi:predicted dehydrogenase